MLEIEGSLEIIQADFLILQLRRMKPREDEDFSELTQLVAGRDQTRKKASGCLHWFSFLYANCRLDILALRELTTRLT